MKSFAPILAVSTFLAVPALGLDRASAADLAVKNPPIPYAAPVPFTWTGLLVGGEIGYGTDDLNATVTGIINGATAATNGSFVAGGVVNLLYQLPGTNIVIGNELSIDRVFASTSTSSQPSWLGKADLVLGFAFGQWLPYLKGGFAYQAMDGNLTVANGVLSVDPRGDGWTIGAGLDYAILGTPVVVGISYDHVDITGPSLNIQNAAFLTTGSRFDQFMARALFKF